MPVYEYRDGETSTNHYNHVQVALHRQDDTIRMEIPKLKTLDLILQKDAWIIVGRVLNDIPVAAWTDFQTVHRENLHGPIKCKIRLYHAHVPMIFERTLEAMDLILGEELAKQMPDEESDIIPFKKD